MFTRLAGNRGRWSSVSVGACCTTPRVQVVEEPAEHLPRQRLPLQLTARRPWPATACRGRSAPAAAPLDKGWKFVGAARFNHDNPYNYIPLATAVATSPC